MDEKNTNQETNFVRIDISEKQIIATKKGSDDFLYVSENGVEFGKIICPEGGTLWYPLKNIHGYDDTTKQTADGSTVKMYHIDQPSGTEFDIHYSNGEGKEDTVKTVTIDELKDMFQSAKREYAQANSTFVNMQIPSSWGKISDEKPEYVRVSIPIEVDGKKNYYTFFLDSQKNWHESTKKEGYHYFGFPRMNNNGEAWEINLVGNLKDDQGQFLPKEQQPTLTITSAELKEHVEAAVNKSVSAHKFESHSFLDDMKKNNNASAEENATRPFHRSR